MAPQQRAHLHYSVLIPHSGVHRLQRQQAINGSNVLTCLAPWYSTAYFHFLDPASRRVGVCGVSRWLRALKRHSIAFMPRRPRVFLLLRTRMSALYMHCLVSNMIDTRLFAFLRKISGGWVNIYNRSPVLGTGLILISSTK